MADHPSDPPQPEIVARLMSLLERADDVVGVTDDRGNVVWVNDATRKRLGLTGDDPPAITTADLFPPAAFETYFERIRPALLRGETWRGEIPLRLGDDIVETDVTVVGGVGAAGEVEWLVCHGRDLSEHQRWESDLRRRALHDDLTGVAGRALLTDRLDRALRRIDREGGVVAVVFVDVDDLKVVNDELGHRAGDDLLAEMAVRLTTAVRASDTVARVGGDEFVVLLDGVADDAEARQLAERLGASVTETPMALGGRHVAVSASIGVTVAGAGTDADDVIERADAAMYDVKRRRHAHADATDELVERPDLADLAVAVTRQLVVPHLEPIAEVSTGRVVGHQALARWHRPDGVIPAAEFVPAAAGSGLSVAIDLAVLRRAAGAGLHLTGDLYVHMSERLLVDPHLERLVLEALQRGNLPPERLRVGIADTVLRRGGARVADAVRALVSLHIGILAVGVDGPTSCLGERVGGPVSTVQLRPQLVGAVGTDVTADRRVDETVRQAHRLGVAVLATGVEHRSQLERLVELGCDLVEGHLVGPSQPIAAGSGDPPPP
ncbi:MAG TPA: diguanylate cyclase [Acidimicrobiales bacterium]|nr:diguanylate cyclase [Acidimicrobiales bacterium]